MTLEEKRLLLEDICARLPFNLKVKYHDQVLELDYTFFAKDSSIAFDKYPMIWNLDYIDSIKPYLRSLSSMTEEEKQEYIDLLTIIDTSVQDIYIKVFNWYHIHHFDYRGLIERGFALEAIAGIYE